MVLENFQPRGPVNFVCPHSQTSGEVLSSHFLSLAEAIFQSPERMAWSVLKWKESGSDLEVGKIKTPCRKRKEPARGNKGKELLDLADFHVAVGHLVSVVLEADVAFGGLAEVLELAEFGSGDLLVPVF